MPLQDDMQRWPTPQPAVGAATNDTRAVTIVVAAIDSVDPTLADAAYRCDGIVDEAQINTAIGVLL